MELSLLQKCILQYAKDNYFHVTLQEFIDTHPAYERENVVEAFKDLSRHHVASAGRNVFDGFIGVTNYGWKLMGWDRSKAYVW